MNTPEPCVTCEHLYYDATRKDDPRECPECKLGLSLGRENCQSYERWLAAEANAGGGK